MACYDKKNSFIQKINNHRTLDSKKSYIYDFLRRDLDNAFTDDISYDSELDCGINCNVFDLIQSLAMYISENEKMEYGIIIGFSDRDTSKAIAEEIASFFIEKNIKVHIFGKSCPVLELAFATNWFHCITGMYIDNKVNMESCIEYKIFNRKSKSFLKISDYDVLYMIDKDIFKVDEKKTVRNLLYHQLDGTIDSLYVAELHKQVREEDSLRAMKELVYWIIYNEYLEK